MISILSLVGGRPPPRGPPTPACRDSRLLAQLSGESDLLIPSTAERGSNRVFWGGRHKLLGRRGSGGAVIYLLRSDVVAALAVRYLWCLIDCQLACLGAFVEMFCGAPGGSRRGRALISPESRGSSPLPHPTGPLHLACSEHLSVWWPWTGKWCRITDAAMGVHLPAGLRVPCVNVTCAICQDV